MNSRRKMMALGASSMLVLAACSSGASGGSGGAGSTITVETVGDASVGGASTAPYTDGFNAWVAQVNAAGGVAGHKIETSFCDSNVDPAKASACMRSAANDSKVMALAGGLSLVGPTAIAPAAQKAGLLYVPSFTTGLQDASMPNTFLVDAATTGWMSGATGYLVSKVGLKSVALIRTDVPGTSQNGALVKSTVEKAGGKFVAEIPVPLTATDYLPALTEAASKGADMVIANLGSDGAQALASAVVSGGFASKLTVLVSSSQQALPKVLAAAQAGVKMYSFDSYSIANPDGQGHATMLAAASLSKSPDAWKDGRWVTGYMAGQAFGEIVKGAGSDITRASLLKSAQTGSFTVPGIADPLSLKNAPSSHPALAIKSIYITTIPHTVVAGPVPAFSG